MSQSRNIALVPAAITYRRLSSQTLLIHRKLRGKKLTPGRAYQDDSLLPARRDLGGGPFDFGHLLASANRWRSTRNCTLPHATHLRLELPLYAGIPTCLVGRHARLPSIYRSGFSSAVAPCAPLGCLPFCGAFCCDAFWLFLSRAQG